MIYWYNPACMQRLIVAILYYLIFRILNREAISIVIIFNLSIQNNPLALSEDLT